MMKIISEEEKQFVDAKIAELLERFDSVSVLVTRHDGGQTESAGYDNGGGNFYARLGQIHEWLCIQDQYQRDWASRQKAE